MLLIWALFLAHFRLGSAAGDCTATFVDNEGGRHRNIVGVRLQNGNMVFGVNQGGYLKMVEVDRQGNVQQRRFLGGGATSVTETRYYRGDWTNVSYNIEDADLGCMGGDAGGGDAVGEDCACTDEYNQTAKNGFVEAWCSNWDSSGSSWCYLKGGLSAKNCPGARKSGNGNFYYTTDSTTCNGAAATRDSADGNEFTCKVGPSSKNGGWQTAVCDNAKAATESGRKISNCRKINKAPGHSFQFHISKNPAHKVIVDRSETISRGGQKPWAFDLYIRCDLTQVVSCACTGDNSMIPSKNKKFAGTDYGKSCQAWDMDHRYCNNERSLQKDNRKCWCPKKWCYVAEGCEEAKPSALFPGRGLFYSYESCGEETCHVWVDEFGDATKEELIADSKDALAGLNPKTATTEELAELIIQIGTRIEYLEED